MKLLRIIVSTAVLTVALAAFSGFVWLKPPRWIFPAFFAVVLFLALMRGRVFCSFLCPFGALLDFFSWLGHLKHPYRKQPLLFFWRRTWLVLTLTAAVTGTMLPLVLAGQAGVFGRLAAQFIQPPLAALNNALAWLPFYAARPSAGMALAVVSGAIALAAFAFAVWRGRVFCNTLCPVGLLLGVTARFSVLKLAIDKAKCRRCGACERVCKSGCIDSAAGELDFERCVGCFNCAASCKFGALKTTWPHRIFNSAKPGGALVEKVDPGRRKLLGMLAVGVGVAGGAGLAGAVKLAGRRSAASGGTVPVLPPGAGSLSRFRASCIGCQLCVVNCVGKTLVPESGRFDFGGFGQPRLSATDGFCQAECRRCMEVCPVGALELLSPEEKRRCKLGEAEYIMSRCIIVTEGTSCGACAEHCPTGALDMAEYKNTGLTIPRLDAAVCVGCGACEYICPAVPVKAILVHGLARQSRAALVALSANKDMGPGDFPF